LNFAGFAGGLLGSWAGWLRRPSQRLAAGWVGLPAVGRSGRVYVGPVGLRRRRRGTVLTSAATRRSSQLAVARPALGVGGARGAALGASDWWHDRRSRRGRCSGWPARLARRIAAARRGDDKRRDAEELPCGSGTAGARRGWRGGLPNNV
jgi:hypothetical protein